MEFVNLTSHTDRTEIALQGVFDVSRTRAVYEAFNESLIRALPLEVRTEQLERLDAAALQLLVAFHEAARAQGLQFSWHSVSPLLRSGAESLGLTEALGLSA